MSVTLYLQSESSRKRLYRRDDLTRLAERVCAGESISGEVEVSVLFCDDDAMRALNKQYRGEDKATDVLSFEQDGFAAPGARVLGDIVIPATPPHSATKCACSSAMACCTCLGTTTRTPPSASI